MLFFVTFVFFAVLAHPLAMFTDGSDFSLAVSSFGLAHPPSYPLYTLLAYPFSILPVGTISFKLNIFTSLISALFVHVVYRMHDGDKMVKFFICLFVILSLTFLENAVAGEVYSLNLLLFSLIYFWSQKFEDRRYFLGIAFIFGIGLGNHHTLAFIMFFIIYSLAEKKNCPRLHEIITAAGFFLLGSSIYLYLPLRASVGPEWNWGNPINLNYVVSSLTRKDFAPAGFDRTFEFFLAQLKAFNPLNEVGITAAVFIVISLILLILKDIKLFLSSMMLIVLYSVVIVAMLGFDETPVNRMSEIYAVFFIPAYFIMANAGASVLAFFNDRIKTLAVIVLSIALIANARPLIAALISYERNMFPSDYARAQLESLPQNAVLIIDGGERDFLLSQLHRIEKVRSDVTLISLVTLGKRWNLRNSLDAGITHMPGFEGESDRKKAILKGVVLYQIDIKGRRVFTNISEKDKLPHSLLPDPNGLLFEFRRRSLLSADVLRYRSAAGVMSDALESLLSVNSVELAQAGRLSEAEAVIRTYGKLTGDSEKMKELRMRATQ